MNKIVLGTLIAAALVFAGCDRDHNENKGAGKSASAYLLVINSSDSTHCTVSPDPTLSLHHGDNTGGTPADEVRWCTNASPVSYSVNFATNPLVNPVPLITNKKVPSSNLLCTDWGVPQDDKGSDQGTAYKYSVTQQGVSTPCIDPNVIIKNN